MTGDTCFHDGSGGLSVSNIITELLDRADVLDACDNWVAGPPGPGQQCAVFSGMEQIQSVSTQSVSVLDEYCYNKWYCSGVQKNDMCEDQHEIAAILRDAAAEYGADILEELLEEKRVSIPVSAGEVLNG